MCRQRHLDGHLAAEHRAKKNGALTAASHDVADMVDVVPAWQGCQGWLWGVVGVQAIHPQPLPHRLDGQYPPRARHCSDNLKEERVQQWGRGVGRRGAYLGCVGRGRLDRRWPGRRSGGRCRCRRHGPGHLLREVVQDRSLLVR